MAGIKIEMIIGRYNVSYRVLSWHLGNSQNPPRDAVDSSFSTIVEGTHIGHPELGKIIPRLIQGQYQTSYAIIRLSEYTTARSLLPS